MKINGIQEVDGSIPFSSTIYFQALAFPQVAEGSRRRIDEPDRCPGTGDLYLILLKPRKH